MIDPSGVIVIGTLILLLNRLNVQRMTRNQTSHDDKSIFAKATYSSANTSTHTSFLSKLNTQSQTVKNSTEAL